MDAHSLSHRDRAVLRAVADGRCAVTDDVGDHLTIDGLHCCDQFVGRRLSRAGLIAVNSPSGARLTDFGQALLDAA